MNNTIYYDSPVSDEQRRQLLFDGQLLVYTPRPSTLALIRRNVPNIAGVSGELAV